MKTQYFFIKDPMPENIQNNKILNIIRGDCICLGHLLSDKSIVNSAYAKENKDDFLYSMPGERGGGQNTRNPDWFGGLGDKTSGHCATVKRVGGP